jgi:NADPH-dependent F420 reductase
MKICVIGAGSMGSGFVKQFATAGHTVCIASRTAEKARTLAASYPNTTVVEPSAAADADVIVLATGYGDAVEALRALGDLSGKVVVDITNPLTADYMGLSIGHVTSAAEEIAKAVPGAKVVKAFNTLFAQVLADGPAFANGAIAPVFFAGDDKDAKEKVASLIEAIGFKPIDAGGLKNARYLEPLAGLNVYFGYGAGAGTAVAPTWISRAA